MKFETQYIKYGASSQRKYPNEFFISFLSRQSKGTILELGCGSGANLWAAVKEGFRAYGIDNSPSGIKICNQVAPTAHLTTGDMKRLPYASASFNCVVDVVSMQHLDLKEHQEAINEVYRVLKPGGKFFSFHLAYLSEYFRRAHKLDRLTVRNINKGLPLSGNGKTCLITEKEFKKQLNKFTITKFEHVVRTYKSQKQKLKYFIVEAIK